MRRVVLPCESASSAQFSTLLAPPHASSARKKKKQKKQEFKINQTLTRSNTMTQRVSVRCNVLRGNSNNVGKEISITDMFALTASSGWRAALPCHKEEEYRQTPSASPEQPAHAWFCGEAYL